jgi:biopolymer transport protein TolQ
MDLSAFHLLDTDTLNTLRLAAEPFLSLDPGLGDPGLGDPGLGDPGAVELAQAQPPGGQPPAGQPPSGPPPGPAERKVTDQPLPAAAGGADAKGATADFSIPAIVLRADIVGKVVIGLLVLASVWSWAIVFEKWIALRGAHKRTDAFEDKFWSGGSVDQLYEELGKRPSNPMAAMFAAAMREWRQSSSPERQGALRLGVKERIERVMGVTAGREMDRLQRHTSFLATVGATAPFIGLFGTVWGIMNAFKDIAIQKNTNLATVAPGISEALFATALGLVAAVPAVVAYNKISSELDRYGQRLEGFVGEFGAIVSRQVEAGAA